MQTDALCMRRYTGANVGRGAAGTPFSSARAVCGVDSPSVCSQSLSGRMSLKETDPRGAEYYNFSNLSVMRLSWELCLVAFFLLFLMRM